MLVLETDHGAEVSFFSSKKAEAFFHEVFGLPVLSVSREKAWTKIIIGPENMGGTTQIVGRMVNRDPGGVYVEKHTASGARIGWLPDISGPTSFYCLGIRKGDLFYLYDFNLLRAVLNSRKAEKGVLQSADAVIWEGEKVKPFLTRGVVFNREVIRDLMEKEAELEFLIQPKEMRVEPIFDTSLF